MTFQRNVVRSFRKAKEDAEGIKNELAFALRRIAKIEELLNKQEIEKLIKTSKRSRKK